MMYSFMFQIPTEILFGARHRSELPKYILRYGRRVLLVYGSGSIKKNGLYGEVTGMLASAGIDVVELSGIVSNPRHTKVAEGATICRREKIDVILAVGGGSVIDSAKAISVAAKTDADCWDIITKKVSICDALPVIAISTIAGTGSEMNNSCVISNEEKKMKRGFSSEFLWPKVSFLDPELTCSVSAYHTACGCTDILSHILDTAYFLKGNRMGMLCGLMESLCRSVVRFGPIAVKDPENYEARANLMWASSLALCGIFKNGIRQPAVCHIIEHELSACYDITHGLGIAILTPRWMAKVLDEENADIFARFGREVFGIQKADSMGCAKETIQKMEDFLYTELALPSRLSQVGVTDRDFETIAENVCWGGSVGGLKTLYPKDIFDVLKMCC